LIFVSLPTGFAGSHALRGNPNLPRCGDWGLDLVGVANATVVFEVGSRPDSRDTFFCLAKRKYPKKRPPRRRLLPALLGFERGCLKGLPSPCMQRAASMRRPYRAIPFKPSGARRGRGGQKRPTVTV